MPLSLDSFPPRSGRRCASALVAAWLFGALSTGCGGGAASAACEVYVGCFLESPEYVSSAFAEGASADMERVRQAFASGGSCWDRATLSADGRATADALALECDKTCRAVLRADCDRAAPYCAPASRSDPFVNSAVTCEALAQDAS